MDDKASKEKYISRKFDWENLYIWQNFIKNYTYKKTIGTDGKSKANQKQK